MKDSNQQCISACLIFASNTMSILSTKTDYLCRVSLVEEIHNVVYEDLIESELQIKYNKNLILSVTGHPRDFSMQF